MNIQENRKKGSLRSSQSEANVAIEKKVDDIISTHAEVFRRGKSFGKIFLSNSNKIDEKKPSLFFVSNKKKTSLPKQPEKEKKSPQIKTKKRIRFGKKKKDVPVAVEVKPVVEKKSRKGDFSFWKVKKKDDKLSTTKRKKRIIFGKKKKDALTGAEVKPLSKRKSKKKDDQLTQFEESIAQVKPDEATWVDQQILANKTNTGIKIPDKEHPTEVTNANQVNHKQMEQPVGDIKESVDEKEKEKSQGIISDDAYIDYASQNTNVSIKSTFEEPGPAPDPKKIKFDEITPDGQIKFLNEAKKLKYIIMDQLGYSDTTVEEIDFYPLREPFSYVEIIREKESLDKRYVLIEVQLSEEELKILNYMKETLSGFAFKTEEMEEKGEAKYLNEKVDQIIEDYMLKIDSQSKKKIMYYLEKEFLGLGKLEVLMKDPNIEDISCDGSGVFIFLYHRRFGSLKSNVKFNDEDELTGFVVKLAQKCNKHISIAEPMLDATMPDGSRIQMTLSTEVTTKGSTFTIRKFSEDPFSPPDLIEFNTMSSEMVAYMWLAVENGVNALIAGGTAAGKTSTMNAISLFIPRESKIVSIEETREINLPHPNWIPGVVRSGFGEVVGNKVIGEIDLYDLMKAALRQRPEYILVGEIRGKEAYVLFQAMATGHTTYSTVHADSAQSLIHRLEGKPIEIPRIMLQALDIVCIQVISRVKDKRARRCKQIIEIIDIDPTTKEILTNEVFRWDPIEDKFIYSGKSYILERIRAEKDISREEMISEIKNRAALLEWMNKNNIREFKKVATVIAQFVDNPTEVLKKIKIEL